MPSRAIEMKDLLVLASVGTFNVTDPADNDTWSINVARLPEKPDRCIVLYDSGGRAPNPQYLIDYPTVQIKIRGSENDYEALAGGAGTDGKVDDVVNALLGLDSQTINGDIWVSVSMIGDRNFIGYDDNGRPLFSLNFQLIINPSAVGTTLRKDLGGMSVILDTNFDLQSGIQLTLQSGELLDLERAS